jgi:hypothetical protein
VGALRQLRDRGRNLMLARKKTAGSVIRIEVRRDLAVSVREGFDSITEPAN